MSFGWKCKDSVCDFWYLQLLNLLSWVANCSTESAVIAEACGDSFEYILVKLVNLLIGEATCYI